MRPSRGSRGTRQRGQYEQIANDFGRYVQRQRNLPHPATSPTIDRGAACPVSRCPTSLRIAAERRAQRELSQRSGVGSAVRFAVGADRKAVVALTAADTFGREAGADAFTGVAGRGRPD